VVAEISALRVFGEFKSLRMRPSARLTAASYILPPALGVAAAAMWVGYASRWGASSVSLAGLVVAGGVVLAGVLGGALCGRAACAAERRAAREEVERTLGDLAHDLRGPLTVIRGEVELALSREGTDGEERKRSSAAVLGELKRIEEIVRRRREGRGS
jgi:signal transduction histidine kinase